MGILLVDDDVELCALMTEYLSEQGYRVDCVHDGPSALARVYQRDYDIVILDVMLPRLDGFEVLRQLRGRSSVPTILLTARAAREDRLKGFAAGADDYLPKPFEADELLARVQAVLRRTQAGRAATLPDLHVGSVRLSMPTRRAWIGGVELDLTAMEFDLLSLFMGAAGRVVSRDEIAAALHQRDASPFERSIDVHVSHLRRKLAPMGDELLRTIRGVGYLFSSRE